VIALHNARAADGVRTSIRLTMEPSAEAAGSAAQSSPTPPNSISAYRENSLRLKAQGPIINMDTPLATGGTRSQSTCAIRCE